jgi:hypothetical protein
VITSPGARRSGPSSPTPVGRPPYAERPSRPRNFPSPFQFTYSRISKFVILRDRPRGAGGPWSRGGRPRTPGSSDFSSRTPRTGGGGGRGPARGPGRTGTASSRGRRGSGGDQARQDRELRMNRPATSIGSLAFRYLTRRARWHLTGVETPRELLRLLHLVEPGRTFVRPRARGTPGRRSRRPRTGR